MKTFKFYLCVLVLLSSGSLFAQATDVYRSAMEKALVKLDSANTVDELRDARNQFERIAGVYNEKWQPLYYVAYADVMMFFYDQKSEDRESILADAKEKLDRADNIADVDVSEINTLYAYYLNGVIMLNPAVNGQKYYGEVMAYFKKALDTNPDNPRAIYLSAFFEENLPSFLRSGKVFCDELEKAELLYEKDVKSVEKPYWGKEFLLKLKAKCDIKNK